jgi:purine-binding chemotaxis protein CheW
MDILKARKKAAEQAKARKQREPEQPQPDQVPEAAPVAAELVPRAAAVIVPDGEAASSAANEAARAGGYESAEQETPAPMRELELLSFRMGGEEYAVLVEDVREVLKTRELTPVPNTPEYILGVTALRGVMLPVIDLCKRLGLAPGVRDEKSRIIVVNPGEEEVGLLVDRVIGVLRIMPDAVKPAPDNVEQGAEFLRGIVRRDDKLYILLDLEKAAGG